MSQKEVAIKPYLAAKVNHQAGFGMDLGQTLLLAAARPVLLRDQSNG